MNRYSVSATKSSGVVQKTALLGAAIVASTLLASCGGGGDSGGGSVIPLSRSLPDLITASLIVDVNKDGFNDLLIGSQGALLTGDLLLINNGNGSSFSKSAMPDHYNGVDGSAIAFASADVNKDGNVDILAITVNTSASNFYGDSMLQLYLGNGDGTFQDASSDITGNALLGWPEWIRTGDFDKDGNTDFLITTSGCGTTCYGGTIYLNDGTGKFAAATITTQDGGYTYPARTQLIWDADGDVTSGNQSLRRALEVLVGDLDNDGDADLFATGEALGAMASFINNSTPGHLDFTINYTVNPVDAFSSTNPDYFKNGALLDINGDSFPDIVGSQAISGTPDATIPVHAYLNNGSGVFSQDDTVFTPSLPGVVHARQWLVADFDQDGKDDLFVADHGYDDGAYPGYRNLLMLNTGASQLQNVTAANLSTANSYTHGASVGDLNNDGAPDLFLNNGYSDSLAYSNEGRFWFNNGQGAFAVQSVPVN